MTNNAKEANDTSNDILDKWEEKSIITGKGPFWMQVPFSDTIDNPFPKTEIGSFDEIEMDEIFVSILILCDFAWTDSVLSHPKKIP